MKKFFLLAVIVMASFVLASCGGKASGEKTSGGKPKTAESGESGKTGKTKSEDKKADKGEKQETAEKSPYEAYAISYEEARTIIEDVYRREIMLLEGLKEGDIIKCGNSMHGTYVSVCEKFTEDDPELLDGVNEYLRFMFGGMTWEEPTEEDIDFAARSFLESFPEAVYEDVNNIGASQGDCAIPSIHVYHCIPFYEISNKARELGIYGTEYKDQTKEEAYEMLKKVMDSCEKDESFFSFNFYFDLNEDETEYAGTYEMDCSEFRRLDLYELYVDRGRPYGNRFPDFMQEYIIEEVLG